MQRSRYGQVESGWTIAAAVILAGLTLAWPHVSGAQQATSPLDALIQGLQNLQGTEGQGLGGAADTLQGPGQGGDRRARITGGRTALSPAERFLIQEFCEGRANEADRRALSLVTEFSDLESDYCTRARQLLLQFGYKIFDGVVEDGRLLNGAVQDSYVLGVGDELVISFVGQRSFNQRVRIDREGRIFLPDLDPIPAGGRTFGEFKRVLESIVSESSIGIDVFSSLGALREVAVLVVGEVPSPGVHHLSGLSTVVDAIGLAGGVAKTGSLRRVHVQRGDRIFWVDFYELLFNFGVLPDFTLQEGDRIVVPPIGSAIAVAGTVKRAGIFELADGQGAIRVSDALVFAGGPLRPRGNTLTLVTFDDQGREIVTDGLSPESTIGDGDILLVRRRENIQLGEVELIGHVRVPGRRALRSNATVAGLLRDTNSFLDNPYLLFAVLQTRDPATQSRRFFPINAQKILDGLEDFVLRDGDRLIVLSHDDIRYLSSADVQSVIARRAHEILVLEDDGNGDEDEKDTSALGTVTTVLSSSVGNTGALAALQGIAQRLDLGVAEFTGGADPDAPQAVLPEPRGLGCESLQELSKLANDARAARFSGALLVQEDDSVGLVPVALTCRAIYEAFDSLLPFLLEHAAAISGGVRRPGIYPVTPETPLGSIIAVTGGLLRDADLSSVERTRLERTAANGGSATARVVFDLSAVGVESVTVDPGDVVRFNSVFSDRDSGPVLLVGEFVRPGSYDIRRGERLSQVITRAGGVTSQAFPFGAVFTRERVRRAEVLALQRLARELSAAATFAAARQGIDPSAALEVAALTADVAAAPAVGRVVIEADPTVLQVRPELDVVLEPGDRLVMPKRPNSVLVTGNVLNPGAMQFIAGTKVDKYIRQAGGFQQGADRDRLFVVFPNGVAQPVSISAFNYTPVQVPPGSTIVVPRDATPFDLFTFSREIATVLSQLAITAASLAVISGN